MKQDIKARHWNDDQGRPRGGVTQSTGLLISWQNGPLGRGAERQEPNGAFVETVIGAAYDRLAYYQGSQFASEYNARAMHHLQEALKALEERTAVREQAGVEGTHGHSPAESTQRC